MKFDKSKFMSLPLGIDVLTEQEYNLVRGGIDKAKVSAVNNGNGCGCSVNNGNGCNC